MLSVSKAFASCQSPESERGKKFTTIAKELDKLKLWINFASNYFDTRANVEAGSLGEGEIEGEDTSGREMGKKPQNWDNTGKRGHC